MTDYRDCVVFFTHVWTPAIDRHFQRLKAQAGGVVDVFLAFHSPSPDAPLPPGLSPDLIARLADGEAAFPSRHAAYRRRGMNKLWGYVDLVWLGAFLQSRLSGYDRFWLVEYDVDYSGDWGDFFRATAAYDADLLTARVRRLSHNPGFYYASWFSQPGTDVADPLLAFMPLSRISRRGIERYRAALDEPGWDGHFEMLLPTILEHAGLSVEDLGGTGPLTRKDRLGLHYVGEGDPEWETRSTHGFRPPRGFSYYGDTPRRFPLPGRIYHPIKVIVPFRERCWLEWQALCRRWVPIRDWLLRRERF